MGSTPSRISGSRAAAVLACSKWATPVEVWLKIMEEIEPGFCKERGFKPEVFEGNAATRFGLAFEDAILGIVERKNNCRVIDEEKSFGLDFIGFHYEEDEVIDGRKPPITCHIDGRNENNVLFENKTTNIRSFRDAWGEPGTDQIPKEYMIQVQHQMLCAQAEECIVSVLVFPKMADEFEAMGWSIEDNLLYLDGDRKSALLFANWLDMMGYFHTYRVSKNTQLQTEMLDAYEHFWKEYVEKKTAPLCRTYNDVKHLLVDPKGTVVASDDIMRASAEYKDLTKEAGNIKKRKDELKKIMMTHVDWYAEHPIDEDSKHAVKLISPQGRKLHTYKLDAKGKPRFT